MTINGTRQTLGRDPVRYPLCFAASWCQLKKNVATSKDEPTGTYQLPTKNKGLSTGRQPHRLSGSKRVCSGYAQDAWLFEKGNMLLRDSGLPCWGRVNVMGALMGMTFLTVALFDGRVNSDVFYAWLIQELLPKTPAGTVIVMDNASFHKRHDMLEAISANQCKVEFLPPYSPDLNPIEHKWAQAKAVRRRYRCGIDELFSGHSQYVVL